MQIPLIFQGTPFRNGEEYGKYRDAERTADEGFFLKGPTEVLAKPRKVRSNKPVVVTEEILDE